MSILKALHEHVLTKWDKFVDNTPTAIIKNAVNHARSAAAKFCHGQTRCVEPAKK
jgi:hypothetical protein